jgi:general secretion pathway protein M
VTWLAAIPGPLRRATAVGLVALVLALAALAAFAPYARLAALREETAAVTQLVTQQERLLEATARRPSHAQRNVLLAGETSGMAGAELQRVISELARQNGMSVRSTLVTTPKREADATVVGVDVSLQGHMTGLRGFLHAIETGVPILFIETLSIKSAAVYQPVRQPMTLDVTLRVRGYGAGKEVN